MGKMGLAFSMLLPVWLLLGAGSVSDERQAIRRAALDYAEGWYAGNAEQMERALHTDLAKRSVMPDSRAKNGSIEHMSALKLVQATRRRTAKPAPEKQRKDVVIFDVFGNTASVKLVMNDWIDYLHLARLGGQWKIVNVLWELTPEAKQKRGMPADP